jgi:integrase
MKYVFQSCFAERLTSFIAQKRALGWSYDGSEAMLFQFDRFCFEQYPNLENITKELCFAWAIRRDTENSKTFNNRLSPVREFARYLNRIGEQAFIIPTNYAKKGARAIPYIYSEEEIAAIWLELDNIRPHKGYPVRYLVIPAAARLLYCCGLRPCEARKLLVDDVDLNARKLNIRESKGHKDRIVMLADDVAEYLIRYNDAVSRVLPGRRYFFPTSTDTIYCKDWLKYEFRKLRAKLNWQKIGSCPPRPYDFRHTFATHRLYKWLKEGKDLTVMLPYLSAYMGHAHLSDTYYYVHLVPEQFEAMSGLDFSRYEALLPEVDCDE